MPFKFFLQKRNTCLRKNLSMRFHLNDTCISETYLLGKCMPVNNLYTDLIIHLIYIISVDYGAF